MQLYALEGFLDRLASSAHSSSFVLKGGLLLAALGARRPTRDIDFGTQVLPGDVDNVLDIVRDLARIERPDGLVFFPDDAVAETIREEDEYSGIRVSMTAQLSRARLQFHVDVNVGDPIYPPPSRIELPRILDGYISVMGYSAEMVLAEKLVTAVGRGTANTRWRDFADIFTLSGKQAIDGGELQEAMQRVASFRRVDLVILSTVLDGFAELAQNRWSAWRRKHLLGDRLPDSFGEVLAAVSEFADLPLEGGASGTTWSPEARRWI